MNSLLFAKSVSESQIFTLRLYIHELLTKTEVHQAEIVGPPIVKIEIQVRNGV